MSSRTKVTVIVIFFNAEKFFEEAIQSVFAQTFQDWELLLVDDGSTDRSTEIALRYGKQYPQKVRYLEHDRHRNLGMSASRNLGIAQAKGDYIAFLDADDVWLPKKLEEQAAILESQPEAAMVYGPIQWWYSWTGEAEDLQRDFVPELSVEPDTLVKPLTLLTPLLRNESVTTTSSLMRRDVIEGIGGFEHGFRGMYEDQAFYAKVCLKAPVFVASKCWYRWRKHPDSACAVAVRTGKYDSARLTFLKWLKNYLSEQRIKDGEVWEVLKEELWRYGHPILYRLSNRAQPGVSRMKELLKMIARHTLPVPIYRWLKARRQGPQYLPPVGQVNFGSLRRVTPISRVFGFDRGNPIDRYYIEKFLAHYADDVRGRVLEIDDDFYTRRFGGARVTKADVLHVKEGNPKATIVADLTCAEHIPSDTFDCVILTQTLHLIYDVRAALQTLHRILKPGGILLTTFPGISQIDHYEWGDSWFWGFTALSARRLFGEVFAAVNFKIETHGNVLAAIAFMHGLAFEELRKEELDYNDPDYEVTITVRATKEAAR